MVSSYRGMQELVKMDGCAFHKMLAGFWKDSLINTLVEHRLGNGIYSEFFVVIFIVCVCGQTANHYLMTLSAFNSAFSSCVAHLVWESKNSSTICSQAWGNWWLGRAGWGFMSYLIENLNCIIHPIRNTSSGGNWAFCPCEHGYVFDTEDTLRNRFMSLSNLLSVFTCLLATLF